MSIIMYKLPLALFFAVMLSACGDDSSSSPSVPESSPVDPESSPVYPDGENQHTVLAVAPQLSHKIDLAGLTSAALLSVVLKHDSAGSCDDAPVVSHVSFSIEAGSVSSSCHYQYATQNNVAPGNVTVLITPDTLEESRLAAINVAFVGAGMHDIDIQTELGSDFPANYVLDEYLVVLGVGTASKVPGSIAQIEFNAGSAGFGLINYTLSHSVTPELNVKVGSINISVSDTQVPPTAQNDSLDYFGSGPFEIDIAQLVDSPVAGAEIQLVAVHAVSLDAWIDDADNNNLTNTRFQVQTRTFRDEGSFDISYVVSDNGGGYAVGTITLNLTSPQVIKYNGLKWLPPLTREEADSLGLDRSRGVLNNSDRAKGPSMTVIRGHAEGQWRCDALDIAGSDSWRQASQADVDAFWFDHLSFQKGGIVSAYAWVESNTPNTSTETDGEGKYWGRTLRTGNVNANIGNRDSSAMLCVTESNAEGLNLNTDKAQMVADGRDQVTVDVVFIEAGEPVADKVIYLHTTNDAALSQYYVTTDANGRGSVTLSAITAGVVRIFSPQHPGVLTDIRVIANLNDTVLTALTGEPSGQQMAIHAKLVDINDNVLVGESLSISCDVGLACPNSVITGGAGLASFEVTRTWNVEVGSTSSTRNSDVVTITHAGGGEASVIVKPIEVQAPSVLDLGDDVLWHPPLTYAEMQAFAADIEAGIKGHGTSAAGVQMGLVNFNGYISVCNHLGLQETAGRADWRVIQREDYAIRRYVEGHGEAAVAYRGWPGVLTNKTRLQGDSKNTRADYWSFSASTYRVMRLHENDFDGGSDGYGRYGSGRMAACVSTSTLKIPMCGSGVDDDDKANAGGACLKVAADASGNWFTNTPSLALMGYLGYTQSTGDSGPAKSYNRLSNENGTDGPAGFYFADFDQLGGDSNGNGGQLDRYCQDLAQLRFGGKSDWQRPTLTQLENFYDLGGNKWHQYGFATFNFYGTKTKQDSSYQTVHLQDGSMLDVEPFSGTYGSCVSTD